jgi:hypothetical protein
MKSGRPPEALEGLIEAVHLGAKTKPLHPMLAEHFFPNRISS